MFDNIGSKIKILAQIVSIIGIICSVIYGLSLILNDVIGIGVIVIIVGSLISWASSFVLYAVGEIVDLLDLSNRITYNIYQKLYNDTSESNDDVSFPDAGSKNIESIKPKDNFLTKKLSLGELKS